MALSPQPDRRTKLVGRYEVPAAGDGLVHGADPRASWFSQVDRLYGSESVDVELAVEALDEDAAGSVATAPADMTTNAATNADTDVDTESSPVAAAGEQGREQALSRHPDPWDYWEIPQSST